MHDDNFQEDLFGKGVSSKKPPKVGVLDGCVKQRFLPYLKMPTEYAVIALIGVLVLLTLSYAFGVKVGRSSAPFSDVLAVDSTVLRGEVKDDWMLAVPEGGNAGYGNEENPDLYADDAVLREAYRKAEEVRLADESHLAAPREEESEPAILAPVIPAKGAYMIHLAAFREEARAKALSDKLKNSGMEAGVAKKGDWYQVYTSGYRTISEANSAKALLKNDYADCYIRKVE